MGKKKINSIISFKQPKIKTIPIRFNFDTDKDCVPDWKDCRPFNPRKQHISRTMKRRIRKLPIVASPTSISGEQRQMWERMEHKINEEAPDIRAEVAPHMHSGHLPHIMSKEAKKESLIAQRLFLSTVKKYPGVVFEPTPYSRISGYVGMEYQKQLNIQQRRNLWRQALREVQKL